MRLRRERSQHIGVILDGIANRPRGFLFPSDGKNHNRKFLSSREPHDE